MGVAHDFAGASGDGWTRRGLAIRVFCACFVSCPLLEVMPRCPSCLAWSVRGYKHSTSMTSLQGGQSMR